MKELQTTRSPSCRPFELETRRLDGSESFLVEGGPEHAWLGVRGDGLYRVTRDGLDRVDLEILPEAAARLGDDLYVATLDASGLGLVKIGPALELTPLISTSTYTLPLLELAAAFGRDGNPRIVAIAGFEIASAPTLFLEAQLGTAPKWASLGRVPHERGVGARAMFTDEGELLAVTGKEFVVSFRPPEKPTLETLPLRSDRFEHFRATTLDIGPAVVTHLIVPGPDLSLFYERDSERRWAAVRALPSGQDDRYQLTGVARLEGRTFVSARNGELREVEGEDTLCPGQSVHPIRHMVALRDAIVVAGNQGPEVWTSFVVPRP
ncbi:MAG: hypothetical protein HYV07_12820 [Deltaproteobacteria bacterium]|nr:hypothetical protein [Deltaproteobacteria bacterium]